jgi:hypothetical protein
MGKKQTGQTPLRLIDGGLHCEISFHHLRIVAAPENAPPFDVDGFAFEEDTWLVMSADPKICEPQEHPIRLMTDLMETKPEPVGSVLIQGNHPLRFLAIVHDVNQEPTWKEEWIKSALKEIFRKAEQRMLQAIGLPLLGTLHGRLKNHRFAVLLGRVLQQTTFNHLQRLWLITSPMITSEIIEMLEAELQV